jgi:hypothetical protein
MQFGIRIIILLSGLVLFGIIFELVRKRRFREELSLVWFFVAFALTASSIADLLMDPLARAIGIGYPPALYFAWIIFCIIVTILYFSVVISDLKSKIKELSQKIALLEFELNKTQEPETGSRESEVKS